MRVEAMTSLWQAVANGVDTIVTTQCEKSSPPPRPGADAGIMGQLGTYPPTDEAGYRAFAQSRCGLRRCLAVSSTPSVSTRYHVSVQVSHPTQPYPPSWLDRVTDRVKRLPGLAWAYYLLLLVLQLAYVHVVLWLNGKVAVGTIDLDRSFFAFLAPYFLWARFHLDGVASAALRTFRPALTVSDAEFSQLSYRLMTLPARDARIVTVGSALVFVWSISQFPPAILEEYGASREAALLAFGPLCVLTFVAIVVSTYHAFHQLRMVTHVHRLATQIRLFRSRPLFAFSGLTARTGMSFLLIASGIVAILPDVTDRPLARILLVTVVPIAVACSVLPLLGMQRRIASERGRLLAEANSRFETVIARLHQRVDDEVVADADKIAAQMNSLATERSVLEKMSTWPWNTETVTAFVTTLVLPVILWLLTHGRERSWF